MLRILKLVLRRIYAVDTFHLFSHSWSHAVVIKVYYGLYSPSMLTYGAIWWDVNLQTIKFVLSIGDDILDPCMQVKAVQQYVTELLESDQKFLIFCHHKVLNDGIAEVLNK